MPGILHRNKDPGDLRTKKMHVSMHHLFFNEKKKTIKKQDFYSAEYEDKDK